MQTYNQIHSGLLELGLSDKEAQLYLSAIKLGAATAQRLAQESELKRATVYPHIDSLIAKGLFHVEMRGVRKVFIPEPPEKLVKLLEMKKQTLVNILPMLTEVFVHASPANSSIKIYYGISGIKLVYDHILDSLNEGDEYLVISDQKKWFSIDPIYFDSFIKRRAKLFLDTKLLLQDNDHAREFKSREDQYHERIKLIPKNIDIKINMVILNNKVVITQLVDPVMVTLIENPNMAEMIKVLFNIIWELID
jgi:sugar-specific transcriptional regulator TrmB